MCVGPVEDVGVWRVSCPHHDRSVLLETSNSNVVAKRIDAGANQKTGSNLRGMLWALR